MLKAILREIAQTATRDIADPTVREQAIDAYVERFSPKLRPVDAPTAAQLDRLDRAYQAVVEQAFISALAVHTDATFDDAENAFDSLSTSVHHNVNSRAGWALLGHVLARVGHPQLVATLH